MRIRRLVVAATVSSALVAGVMSVPAATAVPSSPPTSAGYTPPPVQWGACTVPRLVQAGAQCGYVVVPLDYDRPNGTNRRRGVPGDAQDARRTGAGADAGESGWPRRLRPDPCDARRVRARVGAGDAYQDWVGFDPRGVGSSVPSLTCDGEYAGYNRPYYVPGPVALEKTWLQAPRGTPRPATRPARAARPRQDHRLGGRHGEHPQGPGRQADQLLRLLVRHVPRSGLQHTAPEPGAPDGAGRQCGPARGLVRRQPRPGRGVRQEHADLLRLGRRARLDLGTTGKSAAVGELRYYAELQKLQRPPADGKIGPDEWNDIFVSAGVLRVRLGGRGLGVLRVGPQPRRRPARGPVRPARLGVDNGYAMYLAAQCSDVQWPTNWSKWQRDNWRTYAKAPFLTWDNAWYNAPCINWPAKPGKLVKINGAKTPPILLISETNDAATPYTGASRPQAVPALGPDRGRRRHRPRRLAERRRLHRRRRGGVPGQRRAADPDTRQPLRQAVRPGPGPRTSSRHHHLQIHRQGRHTRLTTSPSRAFPLRVSGIDDPSTASETEAVLVALSRSRPSARSVWRSRRGHTGMDACRGVPLIGRLTLRPTAEQ